MNSTLHAAAKLKWLLLALRLFALFLDSSKQRLRNPWSDVSPLERD